MRRRVLAITEPHAPERALRVLAQLGMREWPSVAYLLRAPELDNAAYADLTEQFVDACHIRGILPVLYGERGRLLAAELGGTIGLHLPEREWKAASALEPERAWLSASVHSEADFSELDLIHPNVVLLSPIFLTPGKGTPLGTDAIQRARALLPKTRKLFALGGITETNARSCFDAGADGIAFIRALSEDTDPRGALERLLAAIEA